MACASSSAVPLTVSMPRLARVFTTVGSRLTSASTLDRCSMIGRGVPAGANAACQPVMVKPGTVSASVGTSGNSGERCSVDIASSRTLPLRIGSTTSEMLPKNICTVPDSNAVIVGGMLWYGTATHAEAFARRQQGRGEMAQRADAADRVVDLARTLADVGDELAGGMHGQVGRASCRERV